jgi:hypothetical protein
VVLLIAAYSSSGHEREPTFWSSPCPTGQSAPKSRAKCPASGNPGRSPRPGHAPRSVPVGHQTSGMATLRLLAMHAPRPRRPCRNSRRGALVGTCSKSEAAVERGRVHADAGRLQCPGPRLAPRGRLDASSQRVDPRPPAREPSAFIEGDSPSICDDAYQLGDRGAGPAADAGAFGMGHALTVADRPTRTNNSGRAQP